MAATTLLRAGLPPGAQTPPHRHRVYSEQLYVLDGEFTVWIGGRKVVLRPGDDHLIPAGTAHAVAATGDHPSRAVSSRRRADSAAWSAKPARPTRRARGNRSRLDMDRFLRVAADLGDEILGSPGSLPD